MTDRVLDSLYTRPVRPALPVANPGAGTAQRRGGWHCPNASHLAAGVARQLGVSHTAIQKAKRIGRITREPDGAWNIIRVRRDMTATALSGRSPLAPPGDAMQNSVQIFPDFLGKQRPKVSTRGHAIIRPLRWRIWGVGHGPDCQNSSSAFRGRGEYQFDRAGPEPLAAHGSQALPDPGRADLSQGPTAHAHARRLPGAAGELAANRTPAAKSPASHRASPVRGAAGRGLPPRP